MSEYNLVNKTNLMHNLFLVYLYSSISTCFGLLCAHHQEIQLCFCDIWYLLFWMTVWYSTLHTRQSSTQNNKYQVLHKYGPIHEGRHWRPRWNNELYTLYNDLIIVEDMKIRRLGWAGHIIRMEEERIPKMVLNGTFHNTRPVGRPRTRWADVVQRDALQLLGVRGWRGRAENRDEWRHALREATARKGL